MTAWGENNSTPTPVVFPDGVIPVSISAYEYAGGVAITRDGNLYKWFGVADVGITNRSSQVTPARVPGEDNAVDVAAAEYSSLALH